MIEMRWIKRHQLFYCGQPVDMKPGAVLPCDDMRMYHHETQRVLQYRYATNLLELDRVAPVWFGKTFPLNKIPLDAVIIRC